MSSPLSIFSLTSLFLVPFFASQIRPDHFARMGSQSWHWPRFYWTCHFKAGTTATFCNPFSSPVTLRYLCGQKSWAGQGSLGGAGLKDGLYMESRNYSWIWKAGKHWLWICEVEMVSSERREKIEAELTLKELKQIWKNAILGKSRGKTL